jgi:hypothetical protein
MREIRQSGSEGGGIGHTDPPYPYCIECLLTEIASFAGSVRVGMAGTSPAMTRG